MGISRDSRHKRRATGGRMPVHKKKRMYEMGRQPAMTKIGKKKILFTRVRGGNMKYRALKLETGNFSWASECVAKKTRIIDVVYNATNNELVRTKTLVKNCIVQIDAAPFKNYYLQKYGIELGKKKKKDNEKTEVEVKAVPKCKHALRRMEQRNPAINNLVAEEFGSGRLLACITSRPGQVGRADGYILEGKELEFYVKKTEKKKRS
jgi:small subunit ribosomal protein S8e